jgi:filamentous hemagglutinin family protein
MLMPHQNLSRTGLLSPVLSFAVALPALAQITPDATLGDESSTLTPNTELQGEIVDLIGGGAIRGSNLFHSFQEFNVNEGQQVYFANPDGIASILSRITGGDPSNIFGTLGVDGAADLFLLNPNGIVFGPSSSLDIEGSFIGSTADAIQFGEQGLYSATDTTAPSLLTINPSALWFNQLEPNGIFNTSITPIGPSPAGTPLAGLSAPAGRSLLLVGGDINFAGGSIVGSGSRIELGGLSAPGIVELENNELGFKLSFPEGITQSNINLTNDGLVGLVGQEGGEIIVNANLLTATSGGRLVTEIGGSEAGGNIDVIANQINLSGIGFSGINSGLISRVLPIASGASGNVNVTANSLTIRDGAQISSTTFGVGNAGNININANSIDIIGSELIQLLPTGIGSTSETVPASGIEATGNAGNVLVSTRSLNVQNGGRISTGTNSLGNGGNLSITASNITQLVGSGVEFAGVVNGNFIFQTNGSSLNTSTTGIGNAGNLRLATGELIIQDGAVITASTISSGNAGDIDITANSISLLGVREDRLSTSQIESVSRIAPNFPLPTGDAGSITISAQTLNIDDGGQISTITQGEGAGGNLTVTIQDSAEFAGAAGFIPDFNIRSGLITGTTGFNNAGDLTLEVGENLIIRDGAGISASTASSGSAGNIFIAADSIELFGISQDQPAFSSILSASFPINGNDVTGSAGDVAINARYLSVRDGARISTETASQGDGGNLSIVANEAIELIGSGTRLEQNDDGSINTIIDSSSLTIQTTGTANAGRLSLETGRLMIQNGATISASTTDSGNAGEINIDAEFVEIIGIRADEQFSSSIQSISILNVVEAENGDVVVIRSTGDAGDIRILTRSLSLQDGGTIVTTTSGAGQGGDLEIQVEEIAELVGTTGSFSSGIATGTIGSGNAGELTLSVGERLIIEDGAVIVASTNGSGSAGDVFLSADVISLSGLAENQQSTSSIESTSRSATIQNGNVTFFATGDTGDVSISTRALSVRDGAQISTETASQGQGGSLVIVATEAIELIGSGEQLIEIDGINSMTEISSGLVAQTNLANAGSLIVETENLTIKDGATITASTIGAGAAGDIQITADSITLSGIRPDRRFSSQIESTSRPAPDGTPATGEAGDISITTRLLNIQDGGQITTETASQGQGGNLLIIATEATELIGSGNLLVQIDGFDFEGESSSGLNIQTTGTAAAGSLNLETGRLIIRDGASLGASTFGSGAAGNIKVIADSIMISGIRADQLFSSTIQTASAGIGNAGNIDLQAGDLLLLNGGSISTETFNKGDGGIIDIDIAGPIRIGGFGDSNGFFSSNINSSVRPGSQGNAGSIFIEADSLVAEDGGQIGAVVSRAQRGFQGNLLAGGQGQGGNIQLTIAESITFSGTNGAGFSSGVLSLTERGANGEAGDITINTGDLKVENGAIVVASTFNPSEGGNITINAQNVDLLEGGQITTNTRNQGNAGRVILNVVGNISISGFDTDFDLRRQRVEAYQQLPGVFDEFSDVVVNQGSTSGIFANTETMNSTGNGGSIELTAANLKLINHAAIAAQSEGRGLAGSITLDVNERFEMFDSEILTEAPQSSGGSISINTIEGYGPRSVVLRGDSDIRTVSLQNGGNITIRGGAVVALDDSDILTTSADGQGGDITLINFFSENNPLDGTPPFDGNNRVDINAEGRVASGTISLTDVSFVENSLSGLEDTIIDTSTLTAGSCIARTADDQGSFVVTGRDGIPPRPGDMGIAAYPTGTVQTIESGGASLPQMHPTGTLQEPDGVYQLPDGRLVLSRECD